MGVISIFEFLSRGLDRRGERICLSLCFGLAAFYLAALGWFEHAGRRYDDVFFAQRNAFRAAYVLDHAMHPGQTVLASVDGKTPPELALLDGWSVLEPWGVWSLAPLAEFAVAVPVGHPLMLQIEAAIALDTARRQTISITADGIAIGNWDLHDAQETLQLAVPSAAISPTGLLRISFHVHRPLHMPGGADPRSLGIGLQKVTLLESAPGYQTR